MLNFAKPTRSFRKALHYCKPTCLTISPHQFEGKTGVYHCYAWLWWNYLKPAICSHANFTSFYATQDCQSSGPKCMDCGKMLKYVRVNEYEYKVEEKL